MKLAQTLIAACVTSAALLLGWTGEAEAGCKITFKGRNTSPAPHAVLWTQSDVRNRVGTWKHITHVGVSTTWVHQGESFSVVKEMDFGCNVARRYRFKIQKQVQSGGVNQGMQYVYYFPSVDGFTEAVVIDLGDIKRFFN